MNRLPLRARLVGASVGAILAAIALLGTAAALIANHELRAGLDRNLRDRARDVARLSVSAPAVLTTPGALESAGGERDLAVEVLDARGRIVARSLGLAPRVLPAGPVVRAAIRRGRPGFADLRLAGHPTRLYAAPIADAGGPAAGGAVLVASDTSEIGATMRRLRLLLALGALAAAAVGAAATAYLTRRGLRPLSRLSTAAAEIERTRDPARRMPPRAARDELGELTATLNRMLASLGQARDNERRFIADAAHELRTPVTALLGNAHFLARHGADEAVIADVLSDAQRLTRLVDDLLVLELQSAAGHRIAAAPQRVDLRDLAALVATRNARVRVEAQAPAQVDGDPEELRRALEKLVENALVHGPDHGPVTISLERRNGRVRAAVNDEGPGPDPAQRQRIFERFARAPDAAARPGSGLGLPIAEAIVRRHGGRIEVEGATFTIELPAAD